MIANLDLSRYKMQVGLIIIFFLVLALFMITSPRVFLRPTIYLAYLATIPFVGIMGLGLTFVLVSGEIDLSFPSVMALSGYICAIVFSATGSVVLGILGGLASGGLIGMLNGTLIRKIGIPSIVVTLGMMFLIRGCINVLSGGLGKSLTALMGNPWHRALAGKIGGFIPAQSLWFLALAIALWFILFRHKFGNYVLFVGDNEDTAKMMGVKVDKTKTMVFILMGVLAAFAGLIDSFRLLKWWPTMGEGYLMTTMATVFVGGTSMFGGEGTILGTFIGAFLIGSLEAGIVAAGLSGFWTQLIYGLLIIIAVTIHALVRRRGGV
ncbi:MAG: ABC transporter permease [Candidatus Aerophobetes bacterium]|nr:ABC transporter permease [Candidatus Aerophobetes bacterium]